MQQQREAQRSQLRLPSAATTATAAAATAAAGGSAVPEAVGEELFITSTTINVAKFIGKYAQMMHTLEPVRAVACRRDAGGA